MAINNDDVKLFESQHLSDEYAKRRKISGVLEVPSVESVVSRCGFRIGTH